MNSSYLIIVCLLAVTHCTDAFLPLGYYGGYPGFGFGTLVQPYVSVHSYPAAYTFHEQPYLYGPRTSLRNIAQHFHREDSHLVDTSLISPFYQFY
ncbi:unnamed protein product [Cylicocyclus nassatus]|uniref:Uncharacterized protein n=1 Tax=Cylicocyclus nassatus TaxID=53992 RepID=A0AA36GP29_CYLNA|nr:unnamed protein product [Cylicocyclus nassatus]